MLFWGDTQNGNTLKLSAWESVPVSGTRNCNALGLANWKLCEHASSEEQKA